MFLLSQLVLLFLGPVLLQAQTGPSCRIPIFPSDGYLLSLQWPITFCYKEGRCSLERPLHQFTIHGLWPAFNASKGETAARVLGSPYPQYCCHPQGQIDFDRLPARLNNEMRQLWPSLKQPRRLLQTEAFSFWRHQWTKHGACALNPSTQSPFSAVDYFGNTVRLYKQFPLDRWLASGQIVPSNEQPYDRAIIHQVLESSANGVLRGVFRLECDRSRQAPPRSAALLAEVQICLNLQLKPMHCAHLYGQEETSARLDSGSFDDFQCGNKVMLLEQ